MTSPFFTQVPREHAYIFHVCKHKNGDKHSKMLMVFTRNPSLALRAIAAYPGKIEIERNGDTFTGPRGNSLNIDEIIHIMKNRVQYLPSDYQVIINPDGPVHRDNVDLRYIHIEVRYAGKSAGYGTPVGSPGFVGYGGPTGTPLASTGRLLGTPYGSPFILSAGADSLQSVETKAAAQADALASLALPMSPRTPRRAASPAPYSSPPVSPPASIGMPITLGSPLPLPTTFGTPIGSFSTSPVLVASPPASPRISPAAQASALSALALPMSPRSSRKAASPATPSLPMWNA